MALSLSKGGNLSLTKEDPSIEEALVGLGWEVRATDGADFDLDASAILVGANGKVGGDSDFCFYNQPSVAAGAVLYHGDNRTGGGDGDDEQISVKLNQIPLDVERIILIVTIHEGDIRRQNFGMVRDAYIRILNAKTQKEIVRFDLTEDMSTETAMIFGELYRKNGGWSFRAIGQGYAGGLKPLAQSFGLNIE